MRNISIIVIPFVICSLSISLSSGAEKSIGGGNTAVTTVQKFLSLDVKGARLSGNTLSKIKPYVDWDFSAQPGWDTAIAVNSYKVSSFNVAEDKAVVSVLYELAPRGQEMKNFELERRNGKWLIVKPKTFMPYVLEDIGVGSYKHNDVTDDTPILGRITGYIQDSTVHEGSQKDYLKRIQQYISWSPSISGKDIILIKGYRVVYIRDTDPGADKRRVIAKVRYYTAGFFKGRKYTEKVANVDVIYRLSQVNGLWTIYDTNNAGLFLFAPIPYSDSSSYIKKLSKQDLESDRLVGFLYEDRYLDIKKEQVRKYLMSRTSDEIRLMRNAIFARYGYKFKTAWLEDYFKYNMVYKISENQSVPLSPLDKRNISYLLRIEKEVMN